jgi:hypothetical protein
MKETLVILNALDRKAAQAARQRLESGEGRVSQSYGTDVLITEIESDSMKSLKAHPGVVGIYEKAVPDEVTEGLDETGRMGVAAWNKRHTASYQQEKKQRKGEGLSWGHPDYEREG